MRLHEQYVTGFVAQHELDAIWGQVEAAHRMLHDKTGPGHDFLGWVDLPQSYNRDEFERIQSAAKRIQQNSQILVVIGIGGSYLGARAAIELMRSPLYNTMERGLPRVLYAGNNLSALQMEQLLTLCREQDFSVNVISKSGTTTEPALAFRYFKGLLEEKYGRDGAKERIYCTTDPQKGALRELANREGYECFVIPSDVGGRYSVLTAVGLLPMAVAGIDIQAVMEGAKKAQDALMDISQKNDCYRYAAYRNILYRKGKATEILVSYEPDFVMMAEWFKQLFGESEGKDGKGIFPASVNFSTDLHSLGQIIQEGPRTLFETVVRIKTPACTIAVEAEDGDFDGLNYLTGKMVYDINRTAMEATILAHVEGGVPNLVLELPDTKEESFGYMAYFFEKACAISGYMLGVNPFNQPGVEGYKRNMFALLGKPGYEELAARLR